jgi:hypothetical protein
MSRVNQLLQPQPKKYGVGLLCGGPWSAVLLLVSAGVGMRCDSGMNSSGVSFLEKSSHPFVIRDGFSIPKAGVAQ